MVMILCAKTERVCGETCGYGIAIAPLGGISNTLRDEVPLRLLEHYSVRLE